MIRTFRIPSDQHRIWDIRRRLQHPPRCRRVEYSTIKIHSTVCDATRSRTNFDFFA
ncbi:hypothetical protein RB6030 [Rhodopirellula baltica SH 1]|uniref:Uncharacterized protein n=1 Tax=Rhodopirellula baltica (strain DSM 10527 / NCIMB 13988 / SH1) TaxID=243090 RepID=Q7UQX2_RHOBA|nr:hypothetical protein RB6030 [Rhodopirellula baltica SH 1]